MLTTLKTLFATFGNRIIGAAVGLAAAKLAALGYPLDPATQTSLVLAIYGIVHTFLDGKKKPEAPAA